jgi:DNA processing protein
MAVPGSVLAGRNRAGHALIRDGAKVVETADDILEEIGQEHEVAVPGLGEPTGTSAGDPLLQNMDTGQCYALAALSGLETAELLSELVDFELIGLVRRSETGQFLRLRG